MKKNNKTRGFISPFSAFVLAFFLVAISFYGWQKYQEKKYPERAIKGEIKGYSYYLREIKEKIRQLIMKRETKNKRALELVETKKRITDKANLYSISIPESWEIEVREAGTNNKLSYLSIRNSYFSFRETAGKKYYDAGCRFVITVIAGEHKRALQENERSKDLIKDIEKSDHSGVFSYQIFKDANSENGRVIKSQFAKNGKTFKLEMFYSPDNFTNAEHTFEEIVHSFDYVK